MADYRTDNPFDEEEPTSTRAPALPPKSQPTSELFQENRQPQVPPKPRNESTSVSFNNNMQGLSSAELDRKEMELNRKKEDLERREKQLLEKEAQVTDKDKKKNWPSCRPFLHHDIRGDIPTPELQSLVRKAYVGWMAIAVTFLWNIITVVSILIVVGDGPSIGSFFLGIVYALFSIPVSWLIYRRLYTAARFTSSSRYVLYFCLIWTSIAAWIVLGIGFSGWGSGGFIIMLAAFKVNVTVGIFCLVDLIMFAFIVLYHIVIFSLAHREYKKAGGLNAAKKEASGQAVKQLAENPELAKTAIKAAV